MQINHPDFIIDTERARFFKQGLIQWHTTNARKGMPWVGEKDPYKVWLSEIILQQTTVQQGLPYYQKFISTYPTISDLANASTDEILKNWEGLGYYSRARNIIKAAHYIVHELKGEFPSRFDDILKLPGVGKYTASAIAAYAFNLHHLALDGNAFRVLARFFGIDAVLQSPRAQAIFEKLGEAVLDYKNPASFNQAMMDFGATQCVPSSPLCTKCALALHCYAFNNKTVDKLPVKKKAAAKKVRYFNYLVIHVGDAVYLQKRVANDIWKDLYEFPLIETDVPTEFRPNDADFTAFENKIRGLLLENAFTIQTRSQHFVQQLTHRTVVAAFWQIHMGFAIEQKKWSEPSNPMFLVAKSELHGWAFPNVIGNYLKWQQPVLF